jgi:hypothetical protein
MGKGLSLKIELLELLFSMERLTSFAQLSFIVLRNFWSVTGT